MIDGLLVIDKPAGWTSHDVVAKVRGLYGQRRVGHAGTLDPDATGVLVLGLGRVTRLLRFLGDLSKVYRGKVVFGVATDTLDAAGAVLDRRPMPIERAQVEATAVRFVGQIEQLPPMVSAVKIGGQKLYEAARRGEEIERDPRRVTIHRLVVESFEPGPYPEAVIHVECSSGTYIRALAADLGTALGGCAHLGELRRLAVGQFTLDDAHALDDVAADPSGVTLEPAAAVRHLERVVVDDAQAEAVRHGSVFPIPSLLGDGAGAGPFAVFDQGDGLLAVYEQVGAGCKPAVVIA